MDMTNLHRSPPMNQSETDLGIVNESQLLRFGIRGSRGFKSYYVLDGGEGVGVAVMIFDDRESANAANEKVREFVRESLHDLGDPEIIAGEVLLNIESA
jgi:hypothetical protein